MILGLAGNFLKSLGAKKVKSSGKKMAKNITNESEGKIDKSQNPTTVFHEKSSTVKGTDITPLEDIRDDMKASSKKSKDPLNLALDGIDNSLFGIIDTLTKTNLLRKKGRILFLKQEQQKKKTLRERMLEASSGFVKGAVGTVKALTGSAWDKLMNFLTWTLLGAVVNYIIKNWDSVKEQIIGMVNQLKEVFAKLQPFLIIIKDIVLWFGTTAWDWIVKLKNAMGDDTDKIEKIKILLKDQESLEKKWKGSAADLEKFMKEIREAKNEEEENAVMKKYINLFDTDMEVIDPETNIVDPETGEKLKLSQTFELDDKGKVLEEWKALYYVDQHGTIRHKKNDKEAVGARWMGFGTGMEFEDIKEALEKREYPLVPNKSSNLNLDKDISSYNVDLIRAYSDEDFNIQSHIMLFSDDSDVNYLGSDYNFDIDSNNFYNKSLNTIDALYYWKLENN